MGAPHCVNMDAVWAIRIELGDVFGYPFNKHLWSSATC